MPILSILQLLKVITPLVSDWLQPVRVPLPGLVPIVTVAVLESLVTVLPPASWTVSFGWVATRAVSLAS